MDFEKIRKDFPILSKVIDSKALVYLDNAATTQKPNFVINSICDFYKNHNANILRGVYPLAEQATEMYENARQKIAKFINASDSCEIIFTGGTTDGINFIANSWGENNLKKDDEILLTEAEHHANFLPWILLAEKTGAKLKFIKINPKTFKLEFTNDLITEKTKFVALVHSSNVLGHIWQKNQFENVIKKAHEVGAKVLLDSAQTIPHQKINVQELNPDFLVFSGHKILGPTGIGILYIQKKIQNDIKPYKVGGSMVHSALSKNPTWVEPPQKFEAGTPPIAQAIGLGTAIDYINENIDFDELKKYEANLCSKLIDGLQKISSVKILGNIEELKQSGHLVSFFVEGIHVHDLAGLLGSKNVCVRAGQHCAQPLSTFLNVQASLRVSFYLYNTEKEVEIFLKELEEAIKFLKG